MPVESLELSQIPEEEIQQKPKEVIDEIEKDMIVSISRAEEKIPDLYPKRKYHHINEKGHVLVDEIEYGIDSEKNNQLTRIADTNYFCSIANERDVNNIYFLSEKTGDKKLIKLENFFTFDLSKNENYEEYENRLKQLRLLKYELKLSSQLKNLEKPINFYSLTPEVKRLLADKFQEEYMATYQNSHLENMTAIASKYGMEGLNSYALLSFVSNHQTEKLFDALNNFKEKEMKEYIFTLNYEIDAL